MMSKDTDKLYIT